MARGHQRSETFWVARHQTPLPGQPAAGAWSLAKAWEAEFVRLVFMSLDARERCFVTGLLWSTANRPRTKDDTLSRLQRLGLAKPTRAKSAFVPHVLTPLGLLVRGHGGGL